MAHADLVYLRHILDAIGKIKEYLEGIDEDAFYLNSLVQDGVIRQLEIIGEATKQVSKETRTEHDHIPWKDMAGMRDKLIHDYLGVDVELIWYTAKNDVPVLETSIARILPLFQ